METKDRIKIIIENEGLTQVEFSDRTGIKTPTLSHVLTGRNNPSTEVIKRILTAFPQYSSDWLISGIGDMLQDPTTGALEHPNTSDYSLFGGLNQDSPSHYSGATGNANNYGSGSSNPRGIPSDALGMVPPSILANEAAPKRTVSKIIVFYDDNTYETFERGDQKKEK